VLGVSGSMVRPPKRHADHMDILFNQPIDTGQNLSVRSALFAVQHERNRQFGLRGDSNPLPAAIATGNDPAAVGTVSVRIVRLR